MKALFSKESQTVDLFIYNIMLLGVLLLPVFIIPFWSIPSVIAKQAFIAILVLLLLFLFAITSIKNRSLVVPVGLVSGAWVSILVAMFLSSVFSGQISQALWGNFYEVGSMFFVGLMFLLWFFSVYLFNSQKERLITFYVGLIFVAIFSALYQLLYFLIASDGSWWIFTWPNNLIGSWYDSAIYFGFISILSVFLLEFLPQAKHKPLNIILWSSLVLSLISLLLINFFTVWLLVGLLSFGVFIFSLLKNQTASDFKSLKSAFQSSLLVFVISLFIILSSLSGNFVTNYINGLYQRVGFSFLEVRPTWQGTFEVAKGVFLSKNFALGLGPNQFNRAWSLHKPSEVNLSSFWGVDFNHGVGRLPTFMISSGLLGLLAWLVLIWAVTRQLISNLYLSWLEQDKIKILISLSISLITIYLWLISFVYPVSVAILTLTAVFTGLLFIDKNKLKEIDFKKSKFSSLFILLIVFVLVISLVGFYRSTVKSWSLIQSYRGLQQAIIGSDLSLSERLLKTSADLSPKADSVHRTLATIRLRQLALILQQPEEDPNVLRQNFLIKLEETVASGQAAIDAGPMNYLNYVIIGQIYESLVSLGIEGAYERSLEAYTKARELSPKNPGILFSLARLEIASNNKEKAKDYLSLSLTEKPDFSTAALIIAQIDAQEGNLDQAINKTEEVVASFPNDPAALFQLGFMNYQAGRYNLAIVPLERLVALSPNNTHANAQYFIGLSYDQLGEKDKALEQFEKILVYNSDNEEVKRIISNLRNGLPALGVSNDQEPEVLIEE